MLLSVKRSTWRVHDPLAEQADAAFNAVRLQALERDHHTCQGCTFRSQPTPARPAGYLEVHHRDDDHRHNALPNLVTVCPFCHMVQHAGNAGHQQMARLTWLPWLSQAEVNLLCHTLFVAMHRNGAYSEAAAALYQQMQDGEAELARRFGPTAADPADFGAALMRLPEAAYVARGQALWGVRLLPSYAAFAEPISYWAEHAWKHLPESVWDSTIHPQACPARAS